MIILMETAIEYDWNFEIAMDPVPKGRPRFTSKGFAYTPPKTRKAEEFLSKMLNLQAPKTPFEGPISVRVIIFLPKPKSTKRKYPHVRPDLDNFVKLVLDGAQKAGIFNDDGQICDLLCYKRYSEEARIILSVNPL